MNYIEQIKYFWMRDRIYSLNGSETRLYFYLLEVANCLHWELIFWQRDMQIMGNVGMSKNTLNSCRDRLKQAGLIDFESGGKGYANKTRYQILTPNPIPKVTLNSLPKATLNSPPKAVPLIKQKHENIEIIMKDKFLSSENPILEKRCDSTDRVFCDKVVTYFNEKCISLKPVKVLTDGRKSTILARCKEHGNETIFAVLDNASRSIFLAGQSKGGWKADFDWIFKPTNFVKILEDKYNDNTEKLMGDGESVQSPKTRNYDEKMFKK